MNINLNNLSMKTVLLVVAFFMVFTYTKAQSQFLDPSFNNSGYKIINLTPYNERTAEVIVQPDGKILVSGVYSFFNFTTGYDSVASFIARYNADGSTDMNFNSGEAVFTDIYTDVYYSTANMELLDDGKILIVGTKSLTDFDQMCIQKFNADGTRDIMFGDYGEKIIYSPNAYYSVGYCLKIQFDGKIVVAGSSGGQLLLARLLSDGNLDPDFGFNGTSLVSNNYPMPYNLGFLSDNKIVVSGDSDAYQIMIMKFNENGTVDSGFGTNGKKLLRYNYHHDNYSYGLAIQDDDKIIVSGHSNGTWLLYRLNPTDGTLDNTFGDNGSVVNIFNQYNDNIATSVIFMPDKRILATGKYKVDPYELRYNLVIIRYMPDGSKDSTFGINGMIEFDFGNSVDFGKSSFIQPDGKIVCLGFTKEMEFEELNMVILRCSEFSNVSQPEAQSQVEMIIYPNPAKNVVNVSIWVPFAGNYNLTLQTIEGKSIQSCQKGLQFGYNTFDYSIDKIPLGAYLLTVTGKNMKAARKLMIR
jgi:uncharacterized delta-60 repeat protein